MKQEFDLSGSGLAGEAAFPLGPVLAGARARGMADAMTMWGLAAVFLGVDGSVLFANDRALALMGEHLRFAEDRLQASDQASGALRSLVDATLDRGGSSSLVLQRGGDRPALLLRARRTALGDEPFQLVKVVAVIDERREKRRQPRLRRPPLRAAGVLSAPH
ncbi:MAG TPA: hypothetical protein VKS78_12455 [Roseiarcus sp.]|nr:hypothetical protein [Roseiarcus sp.]